jgi:hypothetical protein
MVLTVAAALCLFWTCLEARALPPAAGTQAGRPLELAAHIATTRPANGACHFEVPVIGGLAGDACEAVGEPVKALGGLVNEAAGAVGNGILGLLANWMIGAATSITKFVSRQMQATTTPELESSWFEAQFAPMADLGAALGLLVSLLALGTAARRRSPEALAQTLSGIARAGIGTGLIVAVTMLGLGIADEVSGAVLTGSPHAFWTTVSRAWGSGSFGGFESSALAMLIALVEVFAAIFVWLELIVRNAAIYLAVLFFPAALAASIWPALSAWPGRLGRLLLLFVILKPVALIVLSFAGNAAAAGLSFSNGASSSVGTILAATVIFALAAFAPWALMHLLAADSESAYLASGLRGATAGAVADGAGRSVRNAGGLRSPAGVGGAAAGGGGSRGGGPGGGGPGGGGGDGTPGGGSSGGASGAESGAGSSLEEGALPIGAVAIGAGNLGAAAGMRARAASASSGREGSRASGGEARGEHSPQQDEDSPAAGARLGYRPLSGSAESPQAAGGAGEGASPQRLGSAGIPLAGGGEISADPSGPRHAAATSGSTPRPSRPGQKSTRPALRLVSSKPEGAPHTKKPKGQ